MRTSKYLIIAALFLISPLLHAQDLDASKRWRMNDKLLDLTEDYERYSSLDQRSDVHSFLGLFVSPEVGVWCDYISSRDFGKYIPVSQYVNYVKDLPYRSVSISNIRKKNFEFISGAWHARVEFDKRVDYEDPDGYTFSTGSDMMGGDYRIGLDCVWVPEESAFRIERVLGRENRACTFPRSQFTIVNQKDGLDSKLLYNGNPLVYNDRGYSILPPGGSFVYDDEDFVLTQYTKQSKGRYSIESFSLKQKLFRARAYTSLLFNPLRVNTVTAVHKNPSSFGVEAGVDFGVNIRLNDKFKYIPSVGVGIANSRFTVKSSQTTGKSSLAYSFPDVRDYDFSAKQDYLFNDLALSLHFAAFEYGFTEELKGVVDAGMKFYTKLSTSEKYQLSFTLPQKPNPTWNFLEMPNIINYGIDDSGWNVFAPAVFLKTGAEYYIIPSGLLYFMFGFEYGVGGAQGLFRSELYRNPEPSWWYDETDQIYPVIPWYNGEAYEDVKVHNFNGSIRSIKRGLAGVLELGFVYKF